MAFTSNQLAVALFDAAVGGFKAYVDGLIYAKGNVGAANALLLDSGLNNADNGTFAYLLVDKMVGNTLTDAQKQGAADILKAQLAAGQSRGDVVINALNYLTSDAAKADAIYKNAAARFANKVAAANLYDGGATDLSVLKAALAAVTQDPATVPTGSVAKTFSLSAGPDTVVGSVGNDVINAMSINANGTDVKTLSDFDSIDGGDGVDSLNIYVKSTAPDINGVFPTNTTIKNVENVTLYNTVAPTASMADASNYAGVTTLKQVGNAAAVTKLAEATTAVFKDTGAVALSVTAADAAAKATVALDGASEGIALTVAGTATGALNNVIVSGSVKDLNADGKTSIALNVTVGKDVQTLTVNTAIDSTLTVTDGAGTKKVTTVDASTSKGAITYTAAPTVTTVTTGEAADTVSLTTALSDTVLAAAVTGGAGDDTLSAAVTTTGLTKAATLTVTGGAGNDKITISDAAGTVNMTKVAVSAVAGAGDDKVSVLYKVNANDVIDGGDGNDTVELAGKAAVRNAADFVTLNSVLQNFENLSFTSAEGTAAANLDAAQLAANYATISFTGASFVKGVGTQTLTANGDLTAETAGFKAAVAPATTPTYAGALTITEKGTAANNVLAHADSLSLTVAGGSANAVGADATTLTGDLKTATVTLSAGTDTKGTTVTTDDTFVASSITVNTGAGAANVLADLTSLTLSGNGMANVTNGAGSALVTVNAADLASADIAGKAAAGLNYTSSNAKAETITLGSGLDQVHLLNSQYGTGKTMDTVTGLNLVLNTAGTAFDAAKGDVLTVNGMAAMGGFKAFTTTSTNLDVALLAASTAAAGDKLVFQMAGNTYIYIDAGTVNTLDAADTIIKLTGTISLDTLIAGL